MNQSNISNRSAILERIKWSIEKSSRLSGDLTSFVASHSENQQKSLTLPFSLSLKASGADWLEMTKNEASAHLKEHYPDIADFSDKGIWEDYKGCTLAELGERVTCVNIEGKTGVAENGAIWCDDSSYPSRIIPFITQKLIITIRQSDIVSNMHEAYKVIENLDYGFGTFISGPSKTADIEQSLVYGAHGAVSLLVIIISD